jgi:hypothetical protein
MFHRILILAIIFAVGNLVAGSTTTNADCTLKNLPSLKYGSTTCRLNDDAKAHLAKIAQMVRDNSKSGSDCKLVVIGNPVKGEESQEKVACRLGVIQRYLLNTEGLNEQKLVIEASGTAQNEDLFEFKAR